MRKSIPKKLRQKVLSRFGGKCGYCGCTPPKLVVDHMVPVRCGNLDINTESNLMPTCAPCNNLKMTFSVEQFRKEVAAQLERAKRSVNHRTALRFGLLMETPKPVVFFYELTEESSREL